MVNVLVFKRVNMTLTGNIFFLSQLVYEYRVIELRSNMSCQAAEMGKQPTESVKQPTANI